MAELKILCPGHVSGQLDHQDLQWTLGRQRSYYTHVPLMDEDALVGACSAPRTATESVDGRSRNRDFQVGHDVGVHVCHDEGVHVCRDVGVHVYHDKEVHVGHAEGVHVCHDEGAHVCHDDRVHVCPDRRVHQGVHVYHDDDVQLYHDKELYAEGVHACHAEGAHACHEDDVHVCHDEEVHLCPDDRSELNFSGDLHDDDFPEEKSVDYVFICAVTFLVTGISLVVVSYAVPRDVRASPDSVSAREMERLERESARVGAHLDRCVIAGLFLLTLGGVLLSTLLMISMYKDEKVRRKAFAYSKHSAKLYGSTNFRGPGNQAVAAAGSAHLSLDEDDLPVEILS